MEWQVILARLTVSALAGAVVGLEREWHGRAAGLRTHILVCLGSTLFMITSIGIGESFAAQGSVDHARIAAGVVSGIGFLGAGAIIRYGASIRGLTTAASIWSVSAVGLAVGTGMYWAALYGTLIILLVLVLSNLEDTLRVRKYGRKLVLSSVRSARIDIGNVAERLKLAGATVRKIVTEEVPDEEQVLVIFDVVMPRCAGEGVMPELGDIEGVDSAYWN